MKRAMLLGLSLALSTGALARETLDEPTGGAASLAAATAAAWRLAVEAREAEAVRAGAEAEQSAPAMWWSDAPSLEFSHRTGDWGNTPGERESEVAVAIPMWMPGQRSSARRASAANVEHAAAAEALARLAVAGQVRELAWTLAAIEAELSGASAAVVSMRSLADDAERRVEAGESPRTELLAARAELIAAESRETGLRKSKHASLAEWTVLTESPPLADPTESGATIPPGDADAMSLAAHPAVRMAVFASERARARQKLSRDAPVAAPELRILYREEVAMDGAPTDRSAGLGLRVPFGGASRKAPLEAAAAGELARAVAAEERAYASHRAQISLARGNAESAERDARAAEARAGLLRERMALLEKAFDNGEVSLQEILRERIGAADVEASLRGKEVALGHALARLRQSLGVMP
jgi:cobalt-zinc-cadmium efflux system outer membrane protein